MFDDDRMEQLRGEIRARLRGVCSHLPEASFEALVHKIADQQRKVSVPPPTAVTTRGPTGPAAGQ
ncbi:MAG TPA: hypothetical protein VHM24_05865 [Gemmatimonadaceae bacterium]|nr:hypothetical protein [Gemmatimonadaceae bacterium]